MYEYRNALPINRLDVCNERHLTGESLTPDRIQTPNVRPRIRLQFLTSLSADSHICIYFFWLSSFFFLSFTRLHSSERFKSPGAYFHLFSIRLGSNSSECELRWIQLVQCIRTHFSKVTGAFAAPGPPWERNINKDPKVGRCLVWIVATRWLLEPITLLLC